MSFVYASSIGSASGTYSLTSARVAIEPTKVQMCDRVYVLSEALVDNSIFLLLVYVFTHENNFPILVNDSLGETDSNLFSAEIIFQEKPCSQEHPYRIWNEVALPKPQKNMKHTEQGLLGARVIALQSWQSLHQQIK